MYIALKFVPTIFTVEKKKKKIIQTVYTITKRFFLSLIFFEKEDEVFETVIV